MTLQQRIERVKADLREMIALGERLNAQWVIKTAQRELGQTGEFETETFIEDGTGSCVVNGWNLEDRDESNFKFIARSRAITPLACEVMLMAIDELETLYYDADGCADGAPDATDHDKLCNSLAHSVQGRLQRICDKWEAQQ